MLNQSNRILFSFLFVFVFCVFLTLFLLQKQANGSLFSLFFSSNEPFDLNVFLIKNNVLPRLFIAILSGGILGLCSLLLQRITHNSLASDSTLAISSGAQLTLLLTTIIFPFAVDWQISIIVFLGTALTLFFVLWLSMKNGFSSIKIILVGLIVNFYLGGISGILMLFYSDEVANVFIWGAGSLVQENWHKTIWLSGEFLLIFPFLLLFSNYLEILQLGESQAKNLGISVNLIRMIVLFFVSFLCASVVSKVGMLGFVGLAAAAITREIKVRRLIPQIFSAFFIGASLLLITDIFLQFLQIKTNLNIPTGATISLFGAPLLLWLIYKIPSQEPIEKKQEINVYSHFSKKYLIVLFIFGIIFSIFISLMISKNAKGWHFSGLDFDLLTLRFPRLICAISVGFMLGIAGFILQNLTKNPMASPEMLGISAGSAIAILITIFCFSRLFIPLWFITFVGTLITLLFIFFINRNNKLSPNKLLLTGVAIVALFDSLLRFFLSTGNPKINFILVWLSGSTYHATFMFSSLSLMIGIVLFVGCFLFRRWLTMQNLDEIVAKSLGFPVFLARILFLSIAAILISFSTLLIGPLSFIGLFAPHLAKFLQFRTVSEQLIASSLIGIWLMIFSDWIGRYFAFPYEIPAGLIAMLLGGTYFLLMFRKI